MTLKTRIVVALSILTLCFTGCSDDPVKEGPEPGSDASTTNNGGAPDAGPIGDMSGMVDSGPSEDVGDAGGVVDPPATDAVEMSATGYFTGSSRKPSTENPYPMPNPGVYTTGLNLRDPDDEYVEWPAGVAVRLETNRDDAADFELQHVRGKYFVISSSGGAGGVVEVTVVAEFENKELRDTLVFEIFPDQSPNAEVKWLTLAGERQGAFYINNEAEIAGVGGGVWPFLVLSVDEASWSGGSDFEANVPPEVIDAIDTNVTSGTAPVAEFNSQTHVFEGVSGGSVEATVKAVFGGETVAATKSLDVVEGQLQQLVFRDEELFGFGEAYRFLIDWGCVDQMVFGLYGDAQGREYLAQIPWSDVTVSFAPTGVVELQQTSDELCALKGGETFQKVEYQGMSAELRIGVDGPPAPSIRTEPERLEFSSFGDICVDFEIFGGFAGQESNIGANPFVWADAEGDEAMQMSCGQDASDQWSCCVIQENFDDPLPSFLNTVVVVEYLAGRHEIPIDSF